MSICSISQKQNMSRTGTALHIRIILPNCFFITHGTGKFTIENECFPVKENDLIIVNPNVSHTESGGTGTPLEYIVLGINGLQFTDKDEFTNLYDS